mgnify:CR=1 FL=1
MSPTQVGHWRQMGPNLVPRGPLRTSEVPERTFYGQNGPFLPVFDCFLELGGSLWAITVLDEQGIPLRCSGHPTSLFLKQKNVAHEIGPWKFRDRGQKALFGPPGTWKGPDTRSKCVVTMIPTQAAQSGAVGTKSGPPGPSEDPKGAFRAKTGPFRTPRGPEGARYQVKVCGDHESNPDGPIGGSWDQIWPPGALRGPPGPPKGPFGPETSPFGGPRSAVEVR